MSSPSQPLPSAAGKGRGKGGDLRGKLHSKPKQLLVLGAKDRDQLTTYFEVKKKPSFFFPYLPPHFLQSFGGLDSVGVDPANGGNLIFTFRNSTAANQVCRWCSELGPLKCIVVIPVLWSPLYCGHPLLFLTVPEILNGATPRSNQDTLTGPMRK